MDNKAFINEWQQLCQNHSDPKNAQAMSAYMKDHFSFYGIKSPELKKLSSAYLKAVGKPSYDSMCEMTFTLWSLPEREHHYFSMRLLEKYKRDWQPDFIELVEYMVVHQSWWDTVDWIASHLVGGYFIKYPERREEICDRWNGSEDMWLIRTSILFQLGYRDKVDEDLLYKYIEPHRDSGEFFIQKAIGWALRNWAKHQPESVLKYVNSQDLKPLSRREALKHIG